MMRAVAEITREHKTPTIVSLNPIMVDGIGMCGGCRAVVDGKIVFVCVDGPEFDGHQVDFDSLMRRNNAYRNIEQEKEHDCRIRRTHLQKVQRMNELSLKERMKIDRHPMPAQTPAERIENFNEVNIWLFTRDCACKKHSAACSVKTRPAQKAAR